MPKLWNDTIDAHRQSVRDATMDATAALIATEGLGAVSMSRIAQDTRIGRATLYKYFPDVDAILTAWHERQIERHLSELTAIRDTAPTALEALKAVLTAYPVLSQHSHGDAVGHMLHMSAHNARAHHRLELLLRDLIADAAAAGEVRQDIPPVELAAYCLAALGARHIAGKAATGRLVAVVLSGLGLDR